MKLFNKKLLAPSLMVFICMACGGPKKPGHEPNDNILKAGAVKLGKPVKMKIDSSHDHDWYRVTVPGKGYIHIGAKKVPEKIQPEARFAEKQAWKDQKQDWFTGWNGLPEAIQVHKKDTLYFVIRENNEDAGSPKKFPIKTTFHKEFDSHELNNQPKVSQKIGFGKAIKSFIYPKEDQDWFTVKADSAGYLWAKAKSSPDNINPEVRFGRTQSMKQKIEFISGNCGLPCAVRINEKGKYHIRFRDNNNDALSQKLIKWKVDYLPEMDSTEPNGKTAKAKAVSIPDTLSIAVFPRKDREYFKFTPQKNIRLLVKARAIGDIGPEMKLHQKQGLKTKQKTGWKSVPDHLSLKKGNTYFVEFHDNNDDAANPETFNVVFTKGQES